MAKSSGAQGFEPRKNLYGSEQPLNLVYRVANSVTITLGDVVRIDDDGFVALAGVGNPVLGVVTGIVDDNEINPLSAFYVNNTGSTLSGDDTITTASDNQSRTNYIQVQVVVDPAGAVIFYNDADGNLAQTQVGSFYDLVSASDQIDQSTTSDTSGQFQLVSLDPDGDGDASKGLFRIAESQLLTQIGNSTAVISS